MARQTGNAAATAATAAKKFNQDHNITGKLYDATSAAASKAKEVNVKYGITTKVSQGLSSGYAKATEFDKKNDVRGKVGGGNFQRAHRVHQCDGRDGEEKQRLARGAEVTVNVARRG